MPISSNRQRALDTATGREGEVMQYVRDYGTDHLIAVWLRPVGGGIEWRVRAEHVDFACSADAAAMTAE